MSRASRDFIGESLSKGIDSAFQGYIEGQKKQRQQDLFKEYVDPNTTLSRKQEIVADIAPQEFFKMQQQKENDQFLQGLLRQQFEQEQEGQQQLPEVGRQEAPVGQMNQMGAENPEVMQPNSRVPNVNELRQQFGNAQPVQGEAPQMQGMMQPQQQQIDPLNAKRAKAKQLGQTALLASTKNPTVGNQLLQQSKELNADIRSELQNRAKVEAANIKTGQKKESERVSQILPIQKDAMTIAKSTDLSLRAFDDQLAAVQANKVGPLSGANLSKYLKERGFSDAISDAFQTPGGALFNTAAKEVVTATLKPAFGARPLGMEFEAVVDMLAKTGRPKEANELVIKSLKIPAKIDNEVSKFTMKMIRDNPNIGAIELQSAAFDYREQVTDILKAQWDQDIKAAMEKGNVNRQPMSLFGTQKNTKNNLAEIWK